MKILHTGDNHIGFRTGHELGKDVLRAFEQIAQQRCDLVVIAGDLFDSIRVTMNELLFVRSVLGDLAAPVLIVPGNHDWPKSAGTESPLVLLEDVATVVTEPARLEVAGITVEAVPCGMWHRHEFAGADILVMHGIHPHSPKRPPYESAWDIPAMLYDPLRYRYVALGDLHDWHSLPTTFPPREYYCGSTAYASSNIWGEQQPKGYLVVEDLQRVRHVPIAQRMWITLEPEHVDEVPQLFERAVREHIRMGYREDPPVVRVRLQVGWDEPADEVRRSIKALLRPYDILMLQVNVTRARRQWARTPSGGYDLVARWRQFVMAQQGVDDDLKRYALEVGERLLADGSD